MLRRWIRRPQSVEVTAPDEDAADRARLWNEKEAWYQALPAANSVTLCPKCGKRILGEREYIHAVQSYSRHDCEVLTVSCICGYRVYEKTLDASKEAA